MFLAVLTETERNREDVELIAGIQRRDNRALARLYDRYGSLLYSLAVRILQSPQEAEDVVHDVFLHVWNKSGSYLRDHGTAYSWIATLCRNRAVDQLRSKRSKQQAKESGSVDEGASKAETTSDPTRVVALKEYQEIVTAAKRSLTNIETKILDLSYFGGYTFNDISRLLKMPTGTVKSKMRSGMMKLRQGVRRGTTKA